MIGNFSSCQVAVFGCIAVVASTTESPRAQEKPLTFNKQVAPLIFKNCASCHREGGAAPFTLTTFQDVREHSKEIAAVIASGEMPPWLPDRKLVRFRHERGLEEAEAQLIGKWIESGMEEGAPGDLLKFPEISKGWQLGEPDLILTLPDPVEVPGEGDEIFRNFVIPGLPLEPNTVKFVQAIEFGVNAPGSIDLAILREDSTGAGQRLDALDDAAGFPGILGGAIPGSPVITWFPGKAPEPYRDGLGWPLNPGTDLILQLHLIPTGKPVSIQPQIGLYFRDDSPKAELETLHLGATGIAIPAATKKFRVTDQIPLNSAVRVHSIHPHAHRLATRFAAWATLPDGSKQPLILIPEWNYKFREEYHFAEPVSLPAGSVLQMEVIYDNSAENPDNPNQPPLDVRWGPLSGNEMADLWLTVTSQDSQDADRLRSQVYFNDLRRQLVGYQTVLKDEPVNFEANSQIGHVMVNQERPKDAVPFLNAALKARPDDWLSWHNRGMARFFLGDLNGAKLNFRKALEYNPDYAPSHNGLASAYSMSKEYEEALPHFSKYIDARPHDIDVWKNYAVVLTKLGRLKEAEAEYGKILERAPDQANVLTNYGKLLARQDRIDEGLQSLEKAVKLNPENLQFQFFVIELLMNAERFDAARERIEAILKIDPTHESALKARDEIDRAIKDAAKPSVPEPATKPPTP